MQLLYLHLIHFHFFYITEATLPINCVFKIILSRNFQNSEKMAPAKHNDSCSLFLPRSLSRHSPPPHTSDSSNCVAISAHPYHHPLHQFINFRKIQQRCVRGRLIFLRTITSITIDGRPHGAPMIFLPNRSEIVSEHI